MEQYLILKGFVPTTRRNYLLYCHKFAAHYRRSPAELGETEIRAYLLHLIEVDQVSYPTYRQILAALKFLYRSTLGREWEVNRIPIPKHRQPPLPRVLHHDQLLALFAALRRPKYRGLLMTCYAAGLRISEACRLRVEDIDSQRMVLRVPQGKGAKERYTILSPRLLIVLRLYWQLTRPREWLFPGQGTVGHLAEFGPRGNCQGGLKPILQPPGFTWSIRVRLRRCQRCAGRLPVGRRRGSSPLAMAQFGIMLWARFRLIRQNRPESPRHIPARWIVSLIPDY